MILLLDAGNSRVKWRVQQAGEIVLSGGLAAQSGLELGAALQETLAEWPVQNAVLSSVTGAEMNAVIAEALGETPVYWLTPSANAHGLTNLYQPPESLGADRYAALLAAHRRGIGACVVVNVGTAMTVDMLTSDGRFLGGCIAPGPDLMRASLNAGAAGVKTDVKMDVKKDTTPEAVAESEPAWPRTTDSAVSQGVGYALSGAVTGMCQRMQAAVGETPTIVLSGGARAAIRAYLPGTVIEVDELVLEGLAWVARDLGYNA